MTDTLPKAFISYSWSSPGHCDLIRSYAERLINDGVDVVLDQWDLSEGQDKYAFMEKMVVDQSISHVIIFTDATYAQKADERQAGVGTESQIISKEVYDKVNQKKFIPVVCGKDDNDEPFLPLFLKSRIWIDFSTQERVNESWEKLLRALYGKPIHEKPSLGKPPSYLIDDDSRPALPTIGKFNSLRTALLESKPSVAFCRADFLDSAMEYAEEIRLREQPQDNDAIDKLFDRNIHDLLPLRDQLIDWLLLEFALEDDGVLDSVVQEFLERILSLKYRPSCHNPWNDSWHDAHCIFVYEIFLYLMASLIKSGQFFQAHKVLTTIFVLPGSEIQQNRTHATYDEFYHHSKILEYRNNSLNPRRLSPEADLVKEHATHKKIKFIDIMQAELVVFLMSAIDEGNRWYPHTFVYAQLDRMRFPLFIRAMQQSGYRKLAIITGVDSANDLRERFKRGCEALKVDQWPMIWRSSSSFWRSMNMDELDSLI